MSINDDTLSVDVFDTIRSVLVSASPVVTNTTTSNTKTASVLAQYNDKSPSAPQIIIIPADVSEDTFKFGGKQGKKFINVGIECYYTNSLGVNQLADQVKVAIKDACEDGTIIGMDLVGLTENMAFVNPNEAKYHLKTLTITFDRE